MKKILFLIMGILLAGGILGHCTKKASATTERIKLPTVKCSVCKKTIENALRDVDGIQGAEVDVEQKDVSITFDPKKTNLITLEKVIVNAGYNANDKERDPQAYEKLPDCCK